MSQVQFWLVLNITVVCKLDVAVVWILLIGVGRKLVVGVYWILVILGLILVVSCGV